MKKINILIIHPYNEPIDGTGATVARLISNIDPNKYTFSVIAPGEGYFTQKMRELNVEKIYTYPISVIKRTYSPFLIIKYFLNFRKSVNVIKQIIVNDSIDLVISNTSQVLFGGVASKELKIPHITHFHEISFAKPKIIGRLITNFISNNSDIMVVVTEYIKKLMIEFVPEANFKIRVVHNGIDISKFTNNLDVQSFRTEFNLNTTNIAVGTIGRICNRKGQLLFIKAAIEVLKESKNCIFFIIGEPTSKKELKYFRNLNSLIKKYNISDNIVFVKTRSDIQNVLAGLDIIVISSLQEAFPNVSLEAMALQKPLIAFNIGGIYEQIDNGVNGLLVKPQDVNALKDSIIQLANNKEKMKNMGINGKTKVMKSFLIANTTNNLTQIWDELVK